ncbi:MAG: replicative DNA helicase [Lactobacillales bacterium]|jgi:replicative DNA helicase|nr:replicative DNA helicase [Lactobacillales bacterium]
MVDALVDRMPPQDREAEQAVLGSIMLDADRIVEAMEYVDADDFYLHSHQVLFNVMVRLNDRNEPIDVITIKDQLEQNNQLEDAGGISYLSVIAEAVPTSANIAYYAKIVEEKALLRRVIKAATDTVALAYGQDGEVDDIVDRAEQAMLEVTEKRNRSGFLQISEILTDSFAQIEANSLNNEAITGLPTGYPDLDHMTAGFQPDQLIILAARPAVGKTAFALNIAQNVGTKTDTAVAIFSLEMGATDLVNRMLCAEGSINASNLRTGQLTPEEWDSLVMAMGSLSRAQIYIDDTAGIKITEIRAKCRKLAQEKGNLGLIVIDYLQLIEGTGRENRQQEVSEISRQLKKLAKELSCPVIALSQLSRGVEQRQDKRPILSDIRESGSIEQDADIVAFLYREDYYRSEDGEEQEPNDIVEVILEKNRAGARGTVELIFKKEFNKFASVSKRESVAF